MIKHTGIVLLGLFAVWLSPPLSAEVKVYLTTHHVALWAHHSKLVIVYGDVSDCLECQHPDLLDVCVKQGGGVQCTAVVQSAANHSGCAILCKSGWFGPKDCSTVEGSYCTVIGGGASPLLGPAAKLLGALNRSAGMRKPVTTMPVKIAEGENASNLVSELSNILQVHQREWRACDGIQEGEKMDYDLFPAILGDYNSNSFIHGMFHAIGWDVTKPGKTVPGWKQPVPSVRFQSPRCTS